MKQPKSIIPEGTSSHCATVEIKSFQYWQLSQVRKILNRIDSLWNEAMDKHFGVSLLYQQVKNLVAKKIPINLTEEPDLNQVVLFG